MIYVIQVKKRYSLGGHHISQEYAHLFSAEIDEPLKAVEALFEEFKSKFPHPMYELHLFQKIVKLEPIESRHL